MQIGPLQMNIPRKKVHVENCSTKGASGKCWRKLTRGRGGPGTPEFGWRNMWTAPYSLKKKKGNARTLRICACLYSLIIAATENIVWFGLVMWTNRRACWCYKRSHWPMTGIRWNMYSHLVFYYIFPPEFEISHFLGWIKSPRRSRGDFIQPKKCEISNSGGNI